MFRIPDFYQSEMTFDEAVKTMTAFGRSDLLQGMQDMDLIWEDHCKSDDSDDSFFDNWSYEVNAYNVVFENMSKLFVNAA